MDLLNEYSELILPVKVIDASTIEIDGRTYHIFINEAGVLNALNENVVRWRKQDRKKSVLEESFDDDIEKARNDFSHIKKDYATLLSLIRQAPRNKDGSLTLNKNLLVIPYENTIHRCGGYCRYELLVRTYAKDTIQVGIFVRTVR